MGPRCDRRLLPLVAWLALALGSCTFHHSRQALEYGGEPPSADATFVSEEDSGLALPFGLFLVSEPDHYTVLLERLRKRYRCGRLHHPQLDFYTDHWLILSFPIVRITAVCEPEASTPAVKPPPARAAAPAPASQAACPPAPAPVPTPPVRGQGRAPVALDEEGKAVSTETSPATGETQGTGEAAPVEVPPEAPPADTGAAPQSP